MDINDKNVNITNLNTVQIQIDPAQANAGKKKKKMSKGKKIALISSLSAAAAAVIIIPPVCVSQCNGAWNDYFERPTVEQMEKRAQFFNQPVTYTLELKQSVPLEDELTVRVESTRKSDDTLLSVVENSVKYDKKTLTFQVVLDAKSKTSNTKNAGEEETKKYFSNFNVIVSQIKISEDEEKQVAWTTTMSGFKINIDVDVPLNKTVSVDNVARQYSAAGTEQGTEVLFEGFTTNTNPSCLKAQILPNEGYHTTSNYEAIIEPVDLTTFNIRLKITNIQTTTGEDFKFVFQFTDKTDADWVYLTAQDHDFSLKVVYNFFINISSESSEYDFNVDEVKYDERLIGPFDTNLNIESLVGSITYAREYVNPPTIWLPANPIEEIGDHFYVKVRVSNPDLTIEESKKYDVILTLKDGTRTGVSFDFNLVFNVTYDEFMGRDGYIEVTEQGKTKRHWFTSFTKGSNICLNDTEEKLDIISDNNTHFKRETFNYLIHFNPEKSGIPDNFLKYCKAYNSEIIFEKRLTKISNGFLYGCEQFNKPINLPSQLRTIGENFMAGCTSFNNGVDQGEKNDFRIPNEVEAIGGNFLNGTRGEDGTIHTNFHQKVVFQTELPVLQTISDNFLKDQIWFNYELNLPSTVKMICPGFLQGCIRYNQPLTLPASLTWTTLQGKVIPGIGDKFMFNCNSMVSQIDVRNLSENILPDFKEDLSSDNRGILSSENPDSPLVKTGVTFEGASKKNFANKLKDLSGEEYDETKVYRKTIAAPSFVSEPDDDKVYVGDAEGKDTFEYDVTGFKTNVLYGKLGAQIDYFECDGDIDKNDIKITINRKQDEQVFDCHFSIPQIDQDDDGTTFNYSLKFIDETGAEVKTIEGFQATINFNLWQGRECVIVDDSGDKPVYHWATSLVGSNICLGNEEAIEKNLPILTDDNQVYPRDSFNFSIWLNPKLTTIPENFLRGCTKFNQPIYLSKPLQTISPNFLYGCTNFNNPIKLPSTLKKLYTKGFMYETQNMIDTVDFGTLDASVIETSELRKNYLTFTTTNKLVPTATLGVNITAENNENLEEIASRFENLDGWQPTPDKGPYWRRVNVIKH